MQKKNILKFLKFGVVTIFLLVAIFSVSKIFSSDFLSLNPGQAHAISLHDNLDPNNTGRDQTWIFNSAAGPGVWNICLGLANAFAALVILFFAVVNIAHIQYDTYEIKKALPNLILGVVLANFSMFICRMLVDLTQVISVTFINQSHNFLVNLTCTFLINTGSTTANMFTNSWGMQVAIIVLLIVMIIAFIVAFLLFIRQIIILVLAAVSPLAFVMMGFGLTQGLFKQWIGMFLRWTFMGPVSIGLIWMASMVGQGNCTRPDVKSAGFIGFVLSMGLMIAAVIAPFKLGGAVMAAWGGMGKKIAGAAGSAAWNNPWTKAKRAQVEKNLRGAWGNTKMGRAAAKYNAEADWHKGEMEEDETKRKGRGTDDYRRGQGKISNAEETAERQIGLKRVKEQVADLDLTSREGLGEAFHRMSVNGDDLGTKALLEHAAENAMVTDIMGEAKKNLAAIDANTNIDDAEKARQRAVLLDHYGISEQQLMARGLTQEQARNFDLDDGSMENQRIFARAATKGDLKAENRIQEAWVKSGIADAKDIVSDPGVPGGYRRLNLGDMNEAGISDQEKRERTRDHKLFNDMTIKRFQSPDAHKAIRNLRKETLFNNAGELSEVGVELLKNGLLTDAHVDLLNRGRASLLQKFNENDNVERLEAEALAIESSGEENAAAKAANLRKVAVKLKQMGMGGHSQAEQVIVNTEGAQNRGAGGAASIRIDQVNPALAGQNANPQVQQRIIQQATQQVQNQIVERVTTAYAAGQTIEVQERDAQGALVLRDAQGQVTQDANLGQNRNVTVNAIDHINRQVQANPNLSDNFKAHIRGIAALKGAQANVARINSGSINADQGEQIMQDVTAAIDAEIGNALSNGIPISPIVQDIISSVKGPVQAVLKTRVKETIAASTSPVIRTNLGSIDAHTIIGAHQASQPMTGEHLSPEEVKLRFISRLQQRAGGQQLSANDLERAWRLVEIYEGEGKNGQQGQQRRRGRAQQNVVNNANEILDEVEMEE